MFHSLIQFVVSFFIRKKNPIRRDESEQHFLTVFFLCVGGGGGWGGGGWGGGYQSVGRSLGVMGTGGVAWDRRFLPNLFQLHCRLSIKKC